MDEKEKRLIFLKLIAARAGRFTRKNVIQVKAIRKDRSHLQHMGTAFLLRNDRINVIVTALHILEQIARADDLEALAFWGGAGPFITPGFVLSWRDLDIAIISPNKIVNIGETKSYWGITSPNHGPIIGSEEYYLAHGFPERLVRWSAIANGPIARTNPHLAGVHMREEDFKEGSVDKAQQILGDYPLLPRNLIQEHQFALDYSEEGGPLLSETGEEITDSYVTRHQAGLYMNGSSFEDQPVWGSGGMSGSPVWDVGAVRCNWNINNWTEENMQFAGIVTHWNEGKKILVATKSTTFFHRWEKEKLTNKLSVKY